MISDTMVKVLKVLMFTVFYVTKIHNNEMESHGVVRNVEV